MVSSAGSIATSAQAGIFGLHNALDKVSISTARLASGNRLVRAGDDVAALTQSTKLQSNITSLRQALQNTTQADSFLQTAYSGLSNISDILNDLKSLAVQSSSGSITDADRAFLQVNFDELTAEIDSIAQNTSFNDINLLDGTLSEENLLQTPTTAATAASASLAFAANIGAGQTVVVNGVTFTEGVEFAAGGSINASLNNLATAINNSTNLSVNNVFASANLGTLTLSDTGGGVLGFTNTVNEGASTAAFTTSGDATAQANVYSFGSGANDGLTKDSVVHVNGTVGDPLVNTLSQTEAQARLSFTGQPNNNQTFRVDNSNGGTINFRFRTSVAVPNTDVQIGSTVEETVQNLIETIHNYTGTNRYGLDQLDFVRDGTDLIVRSKTPGNPLDLNGVALNVTEAASNVTLDTTTLNNGTNTGVNTTGVTNKDFLGTINGFTTTFNGADDITAQVTVGDFTYQAEINDTTPAANGFVRFKSTTTGGGYFDVELATAGGLSVNNQADADIYAARLDAAFSTLTFNQNRIADSFNGVNNLIGATAEFQLGDFTNVDIDRIDVYAPPTSNTSAILEVEVNGEVFRSNSNLGDSISQFETIELNSLTTSNKITLRTGDYQIDLSTQTLADTFEQNLETSFGLGNGSGSVNFQFGASPDNSLNVSIGAATTQKLFGGQTPSVLTQADAVAAQPIIDGAIDEVAGLLADVGALQERTSYAANGLTSEIQYKDEARAALADTDLAYEATALALATVQAQSAIAVIAQTQSLALDMVSLLKASA